jgi:putative transposase
MYPTLKAGYSNDDQTQIFRPVYLLEFQDGVQAKPVNQDGMGFYTTKRPHTALDNRSPDDAFLDIDRTQMAA